MPRAGKCPSSRWEGKGLEAGGEFGALSDCTLGVELGRDVRAADDVRLDPVAAQFVRPLAYRFLARTDHHVVDLEYLPTLATRAEADVQAIIVDALVVHFGQLRDALGFQGRPVHP